MIKKKPPSLIILFLTAFCATHAIAQPPATDQDQRIWFSQPAREWNEALPVGNGRLGAMVFGGVDTERLQLNEESIWVGKDVDFVNPKARQSLTPIRKLLFAGKYAEAQQLAQETMMGNKQVWSTYQTLGDVHLSFKSHHNFSDYQRSLDLERAVVQVSYRSNNVRYTREVFSSAPDQVLVMRLTADKPAALTFLVNLSRPGNKASVSQDGSEITMREHVGDGVGVKLVARLKIVTEGGTVQVDGDRLQVEGASVVTLLLTAATDYWGNDPENISAKQLAAALQKNYEVLLRDHVADYQHYFKRVDLDLGKTDAVYFPTDMRLRAVQNGNTDPHLIKLYYQFGRYLLISSSRPGGLPANLQGIWADGLTPPWSADYHININIQMNYWPAEITNLPEMHLPFFTFLQAMQPDARKTARDMYGVDGTVAHFTTDAWHFTEPYGQTQWAMWPMGMAWCVAHAWEHYLFTGDREFLKSVAYPLMKEAATFCMNYLTEDPHTKYLVSGPSISPENKFKTKSGEVATMVMGPAMDHMIIRHLLTSAIEATRELNTDAAYRKKMEKTLTRLAPTQIGSDGRIMEWTEEFEEPEPGHRHISHLYALHPGNEITKQKNEALLEAARKTIAYRLAHGGGHTGWSRAWIINFFARLHDGETAYQNLVALLQKSTLPNLFDNHPPFQIDGNFGAVAGVTEMLLQSHAGEVHLLPALPSAWRSGHIRGICARGGFEVEITWKDGKLTETKVVSKLGNPCAVRYGDRTITFETEKGKAYVLNERLEQIQR